MGKRTWSDREILILKREYKNFGSDIPILLSGHSRAALNGKAYELGIRVRKEVWYSKIAEKQDRKVEKTCCICGKEFRVSLYRSETAKYCSFKCYWKSMRKNNWVEVMCSNCGKKFEKRSSRLKLSDRYFCSRSCHNLWHRGKNNVRWTGYDFRHSKEWELIREKVLKRDGFSCVLCGSISKLEVHHITPFHSSGHNYDYNLITLCKSCHAKAENNYRRDGNSSIFWIKFLTRNGEYNYYNSVG